MRGKIVILLILTTLISQVVQTTITTKLAPDYSVVIGREDKHQIVRYDINSKIFKTPLNNVANPKPLKGTFSLNFTTFLDFNNLPVVCQKVWQKKRFWSNIATDVEGKCEHWEFNQGHIWRLNENPKTQDMEEVYTFQHRKSDKKFCIKITSMAKKEPGEFTNHSSFKKGDADPECLSLITLFISKSHYQLSPFDKNEFSITIQDPSGDHVVRLRKDSWLAKNPLIDKKHRSMHISFNFANLLGPSQYPRNAGCIKAKKSLVRANYMYGDNTRCAYGLISTIPFVFYHEETETMPYDFVFLKLNSFEGHEFFVDLVGMNVLHGQKSKFFTKYMRQTGSRNNYKMIDFLYLYVPRSEYIVEHQETVHKFLRALANMILFILPAFCILFFNSDYKAHGIYWMQFGIVFDIISNITWSTVMAFQWQEYIFIVYLILVGTFFYSLILSEKKQKNLILAWQIWVVIDYFLMALLMHDKGTVFYSILNICVFGAIVYQIKKKQPKIPDHEYLISFAVSLSMLNQLGNIWYYTTSLNRIFYVLGGLQIHDKNPLFYYIGFGSVLTVIAIGRIFMSEFISWNAEARLQVSTHDEDEGVSVDHSLQDDSTFMELQKKIAGKDFKHPDESYDTEDN